MLNIINSMFVLLFGIILSLGFADISIRDNKKSIILIYMALSAVQGILCILSGMDLVVYVYPITTHLPLILIIYLYYKKSIKISIISVFGAYLFCTPRKFIGTFISSIYMHNFMGTYESYTGLSDNVSAIAQILITIPLLLLINRYFTPLVTKIKNEKGIVQNIYISLPAIYYVFIYYCSVYTDALYAGNVLVFQFIDSLLVVVYFVSSVISLYLLNQNSKLAVEKNSLNMIYQQSLKEIQNLKESHELAKIYRHDMRHHLQYIDSCIANLQYNKAQNYIKDTCIEIDNSKVITYCMNDTINLIISAYIQKAQKHQISCTVNICAIVIDKIAEVDMCSLLSNAYENAINACKKIEVPDKRWINLRLRQEKSKLYMEISNSCEKNVQFENGIPSNNAENHGIGTKSMVYIIKKYSGNYLFECDNCIFCFRMVI